MLLVGRKPAIVRSAGMQRSGAAEASWLVDLYEIRDIMGAAVTQDSSQLGYKGKCVFHQKSA